MLHFYAGEFLKILHFLYDRRYILMFVEQHRYSIPGAHIPGKLCMIRVAPAL